MQRFRFSLVLVVVGLLSGAFPIAGECADPGTSVAVSAAARVGNWRTDLWVLNVDDHSANFALCWLNRDTPNSPDDCLSGYSVPGGAVAYYEDVLLTEFSMNQATGAIQVEADAPIAVWARMYAVSPDGTFGQGFEGIPAESWWEAASVGMIPGVISGEDFRTNFFALAGPQGAVLRVYFKSGTVAYDEAVLQLGPWMPVLRNIQGFLQLPSGIDAVGQLVVEVVSGRAVFGGSVIDNDTSDPSTLQPISRTGSLPPGTGDLAFRLTWYGQPSTDIDLHVIEPNGEEIYYANRVSATGGQLDRDCICCDDEIENIFWPTGQAQQGTYQYWARYYGSCAGGASVQLHLIVLRNGSVVRDQVFTLSGGDTPVLTYSF